MRILFVNDKFPPENGVVGRLVLDAAKQLQKRGHDVSVFTSKDGALLPNIIENRVMTEGVVTYCAFRSWFTKKFRFYGTIFNSTINRNFRRVIEETKPDIVHFHNIHQYLCFSLIKIAKKFGCRTILTAHDVMLFHYGKLIECVKDSTDPKSDIDYRISVLRQIKIYKWQYNPIRSFIIKHYLKFCDLKLAVSNELRKAFLVNGVGNFLVLHNGKNIDFSHVSNELKEIFAKKYNLEGKKLILFGGRLSAAKGAPHLLNALLCITKIDDSVVLIVAGKIDGYGEQMASYAKKLGIEKNLFMLGWLKGDELKAAFSSASVVVVPSVCFDSFPTMILEAMAYSKPVVATCFGGARESVDNGITGYIVNPLQTIIMAEKIFEILSNETLAFQMGRDGYKKYLDLFTLDRQINELSVIYERLHADKTNGIVIF